MKNNKRIMYPLLTAIVLPLFVSTMNVSANSNVHAKNNHQVRYTRRINKNNHSKSYDDVWANKLEKEGYVFRISDGMFSDVALSNNRRWISGKTVKNWHKEKINFKVNGIWQKNNGTLFHIISKSGKQSCWITFGDGRYGAPLYNKLSYAKPFKSLVKAELQVVNSDNKQQNARHMKYIHKFVHNLHGNNRAIALRSINQLNSFIRYDSYNRKIS